MRRPALLLVQESKRVSAFGRIDGWAYCPECGDGIPPHVSFWSDSTGDKRFCGWNCLAADPDYVPRVVKHYPLSDVDAQIGGRQFRVTTCACSGQIMTTVVNDKPMQTPDEATQWCRDRHRDQRGYGDLTKHVWGNLPDYDIELIEAEILPNG